MEMSAIIYSNLVLRDKTTAVNNARNTFETELKRQLATFEKDLHELKSQHNTDLQTREHMFHAKLREREQKQQEIIAQYEARDEAWQNEKEVRTDPNFGISKCEFWDFEILCLRCFRHAIWNSKAFFDWKLS